MNPESNSTLVAGCPAAREVYHAPQLVHVGDLRALTLGGSPASDTDAASGDRVGEKTPPGF
jgi:hypothetical protein